MPCLILCYFNVVTDVLLYLPDINANPPHHLTKKWIFIMKDNALFQALFHPPYSLSMSGRKSI